MGSLFITMLVIMSYGTMEVCPQDPLNPTDICLTLLDCGVTDVTPEINADQKYRLLPSTEDSNVLFVGALEEFLRIDPTCGSDPWIERSPRIQSCSGDMGGGFDCEVLAGSTSNPTLVCANYIRTVEKAPNDKLLVCGTRDAYNRCYSFSDTCSLDADGGPFDGGVCTSGTVPDTGEGSYNGYHVAVSANNFDQNTSMAILDNDGQTTLFIGSYDGSTTVTDAFIGSVELGDLGGGNPFTSGLVNDADNEHINRANFVGRPFEYSRHGSEYVLFFFREDATEHINQGKIVYPRVGRVCKNDVGFTNSAWGTYIKAQLNCSRPASVPKYYNELEDVFAITIGVGIESETYFYAAFTTPGSSAHESAVCIYKLSEIDDIFQTSQYLSPEDASSQFSTRNWPSDYRGPGPGRDCAISSRDYNSDERNFIVNNPLMNQTVNNYNYLNEGHESDHPLFYSTGVRFSRIVVDNRGSPEENVIFVGTDSGEILKVYDGGDGITDSNIKYWRSPDGSPITGLGLIDNGDDTYLYATTDNKLVKIDLQYGKAQDDAQAAIIYPPYLVSGFTTPSGVIRSKAVEKNVCNGHFVILPCKAVLADTDAVADIDWMFTPDTPAGSTEVNVANSGLGHFIYFNKIRSLVYNPLSYLRIKTHIKTSGTYRCVVSWGANEDSQINRVTVKDCITAGYVATQNVRKNAAVSDAEYNREQYNANSNVKIEYGTCAESDCPWNTDPGK